MLAITENAAQAINALVTQGELPEGAGARIASDQGGEGLELALVAGPAENDAVVRDAGATVFLEPGAAQVLGDKTLDVEQYTEPNGEQQLRFAIVPSQGV